VARIETRDLVSKVAVAGATGRTGSLVVRELLARGVGVVGMVRDVEKGREMFPASDGDRLALVECDLGSEEEIVAAVGGCDAAIWCATGFSDAPSSPLVQLKKLLGIALAPKKSIDCVGIPALAKAFAHGNSNGLPKVIMLSSAGVTRPSWSEEKKQMFPGSAEIPIVRLNPFGILDIKAESEENLRQSGVEYCIFRPAGLNDKWPAKSRPVFSQGDVAVGRIHRADVATILVDCLAEPEAAGKTFEGFSLAGYLAPRTLGTPLARLRRDADGPPGNDAVAATYVALQQLVPGETQDPAALAMGQTYEQLDRDEVGRLGERGKEDAEAAAPRPSSS